MGEESNLIQLKQERLNLLIRMGEEVHKLVRQEVSEINNTVIELSNALRDIDVQIGKLSGMFDYEINQCPSCGTAIEPNSAFCGACGFSIRDYMNRFTANCNVCGSRITEDQIFCEVCGTKLK